jgi:type II secretory pathway pseudopilin PulG
VTGLSKGVAGVRFKIETMLEMSQKSPKETGFSLVEILLIIAVIGILSGVAYQGVFGVRNSTADAKLRNDVRVLNSAIDSYRASGGGLEGVSEWGDMLSKLKTSATNAKEIIGMKGPFIDIRVAGIEQSTGEAESGTLRAYFTNDGRSPRFLVANSGPVGIREFVFDESLVAAAPEVRTATVAQATEGGWIWDYEETQPLSITSVPTAVPGVSQNNNVNATAAIFSLAPPQINPAASVYNLGSAPEISLVDPNPAGASTLVYGVGSGAPGTAYSAPFSLSAPGPVSAQALSVDPSRYANSEVVTNTYMARPVLSFVPPSPAPVTYSVASSGTNVVTISNNGGSIFDVFYETGSADLTTNSPRYTNPIALVPGLWSNSASLTLRAQAFPNAGAGSYYTNSEVRSVSVSAQSTTLTAPAITPPGQVVFGSLPITISNAAANPAGTRVFYVYTTNSATQPTPETGTLYTGPFVVSEFGVNQVKYVKAAAYPPTNLPSFWFTQSSAAVQTYQGLNFDYYNLEGVLVGGGTIANNAALNGSVVLVSVAGQQPTVTFNNNSVLEGDIYAPGTPTVTGVAATNIINLDGAVSPTNYTVNIQKADFDGKVYRRITPVTMPVVTLPEGLTTNTNTITSGTLAPGRYRNVDPGNGATISIGVAGATEPSVYVFDQFDTGNNFTLNVLGPVRLVLNPGIATTVALGNNVRLGNQANPEWLQINMFTGNIRVGNGSTMYGSILNPNGTVSFQQGSTFFGGVTAKFINIENGVTGVVFGLPPPT